MEHCARVKVNTLFLGKRTCISYLSISILNEEINHLINQTVITPLLSNKTMVPTA